MNRDFIRRHWYASVYEQFENDTRDVAFLLRLLGEQFGGAPKNILEVACGGGRLCVPLAQAGHHVTGFDADPYMLLRCCRRAESLPNLRVFEGNVAQSDWGERYDAVVIGGNFLINIEYLPGDVTYQQAQIALIERAAGALKPGGHLYLDFDLHFDPFAVFHGSRQAATHYFEGTDELGTTGRTCSYGGVYDPVTQLTADVSHVELTTAGGESLVFSSVSGKHIPTQAQVYGWLRDAGFALERAYRNHTDEPLPEPITEGTYRATLWARKT